MAARARAPASWPIRVSWRVRAYFLLLLIKKCNGHISPAVKKVVCGPCGPYVDHFPARPKYPCGPPGPHGPHAQIATLGVRPIQGLLT